MPPASCKLCGNVIVGRTKRASYCSTKCQWTANNRSEVARTRKRYNPASKLRHDAFIATYVGSISEAHSRAKRRAAKSGLEFGITTEYLRDISRSQQCAVTGIPFRYERKGKEWNPWGPSVDRIDNTKGYVVGNVRVVCVMVNLALSQFGDEAFYRMCAMTVHTKGNDFINEYLKFDSKGIL